MTETNKLAELIKKAKSKMWGKTFYSELERNMFVADYLLANGAILPLCKVGQTVYYICGGIVYELKITAITLREKDVIYSAPPTYLSEKDFGETVFLTKEEAEEKLRERSNG